MDKKIYNSWQESGIDIVSSRTIQKVHCPQCHDNRKNKRDKSLSVNLAKGVWNCHHCQWAGALKNNDWKPEPGKRAYSRPVERELPIGERMLAYLKGRGFEERTLEWFKIGESNEQGIAWINFPYYRSGELINVKRRSGAKDFRLVADAELIFFNLDAVFGKSSAIITEGEFDAMIMYQCGFYNAVSVPNGASKGDMKLEYLDNCFEYFDELDEIIICTDGDSPGVALREELARRLGRGKCKFVEYPEGCKDANDVFLKHGGKAVRELIENAKDFPVEGIISPTEYLPDVLEFIRNGFPQGDKIGHTELDELISFLPGEVTVITGIPNSGKSAFLDHVALRLMNRHGWKFGILSTENYPYKVYTTKLVQTFAGRALKEIKEDEAVKIVTRFFEEQISMFGIDDCSVQTIFERAAELVLRDGINALIIDPWNTLEHDMSSSRSETEYIKETLRKITLFAKNHMVHVFFVAHPTKIKYDRQANKYEVPTLYDISGSAHFFNMVDNGITVYRNIGTNEGKFWPLGDTVTIYVQKVRNFFIGKQGNVTMDCAFGVGNYAIEGRQMEQEFDIWKKNQQGQEQSLFAEPPETTLPPMEYKTKETLQSLDKEVTERFNIQRFPEFSATDQVRNFDADWTKKDDAPF